MRSLIFLLALTLAPSAASAQQGDFGRFQIGMTPVEARAASPEQQWTEQSFGLDLVVMSTETPVRVGRLSYMPTLAFRDGRLESISFQARGSIRRVQQCDDFLVETITAVESTRGRLNVGLAPGEFGNVAETRTTAGGSEVRFYDENNGRRAGFAVRRGDSYTQVASLGGDLPSMGLACWLQIEMRSALGDFEPLPPPSAAELAAAQEIEPDWAVTDGPGVTELTMPASSVGYAGRVRVGLDCLVISDQRINCVIESEEPQGMHFGDAALAASRFRRIAPIIDGQPTLGKRVRFTIRYELGAPPP
jgi:hypothetical protein